MKRTTLTITALAIAAFSIMLMGSCKKKPTACMQYDTPNIIDSIFVGVPVFFTSCSENESHLEWNMGNGDKFTSPSVAYPFETPGVHQVTLTVWNNNDKNTAQITNTLLVYP